jgi:hypothetical protein
VNRICPRESPVGLYIERVSFLRDPGGVRLGQSDAAHIRPTNQGHRAALRRVWSKWTLPQPRDCRSDDVRRETPGVRPEGERATAEIHDPALPLSGEGVVGARLVDRHPSVVHLAFSSGPDTLAAHRHQFRSALERACPLVARGYEVRSGPDSSAVAMGSACRWTILHSPFSYRNVVVTRNSNGSTDSRSPTLARQRSISRIVASSSPT